jgi:hypothetical protein
MRNALGNKDNGSSGRPSDTIPGCWISKIDLIFSLNLIEYQTIHGNSGEEFRKSDIISMFLDVFSQISDFFRHNLDAVK